MDLVWRDGGIVKDAERRCECIRIMPERQEGCGLVREDLRVVGRFEETQVALEKCLVAAALAEELTLYSSAI
jgi:hypothetical protein